MAWDLTALRQWLTPITWRTLGREVEIASGRNPECLQQLACLATARSLLRSDVYQESNEGCTANCGRRSKAASSSSRKIPRVSPHDFQEQPFLIQQELRAEAHLGLEACSHEHPPRTKRSLSSHSSTPALRLILHLSPQERRSRATGRISVAGNGRKSQSPIPRRFLTETGRGLLTKKIEH